MDPNSFLRSFVVLSISCLISASAYSADKPWLEIRSAHFRVLTDGSERDGRHVAKEFEQMHNVFEYNMRGFRLDNGAPLTIFVAKDQDSAAALDPAFQDREGINTLVCLYNEGWEKQFAVVRLSRAEAGFVNGRQNSFNVIYHEYVHSILHMNTRWLPVWMDEGLAEFFGSTLFEGERVEVGFPSVRLRELQRQSLIPVDVMLKVDQRSPYYHDQNLAPMFYAESWAMVHYMEFGDGMQNGKKLGEFYSLLDEGMPQEKAFAQVFGEQKKFYDGLRFYLSAPTLRNSVIKDLPRVDDSQFVTRELSPAETSAEIAGYHIWTRNLKAARPLLDQALKDDPKLPLAHENMGFLEFDDGNDDAALKQFSQAFEIDPKLYLSLYYKTMLEYSDGIQDEDALYAGLLGVIGLKPNFAAAYVQLALHHLRVGNFKNAQLMAQKAAQLAPSRAGYYTLFASTQAALGNYADAADIASFVAARWHGPDHNEAVGVWDSLPAAQRPKGESVGEEIPANTQAAEGTIRSITCANKEKGVSFDLVLDHSGQPVRFGSDGGFSSGFSDTLWYGRDHYSLCQHMQGMRAIVYYKTPASKNVAPSASATNATSNSSNLTLTGNVAEIEIRVPIPAPPTPAPASAPAH